MPTRQRGVILWLLTLLPFLIVVPEVSVACQTASSRVVADPLAGLDTYIRGAVHDWQIPGLSIAIVKDDSVVFINGYGVRELGKPDPITPQTLFAIGSNTKLFTAVAVGMAVDDGKMQWDAPITTYLPWFRLYDPYASREITARDMLSHRSGLGPIGTEIWYGTNFSRNEILRRVGALKPTSSFRAEYGYQNIMVMGAGQALAAAEGESWDSFVKHRIFEPLGMRETNTSVTVLSGRSNVASPHVWHNGKFVVVPYRNLDNLAPAGSINSNVSEMAQWLRMLLNDGKYGGRQLISVATLAEIESPQMVRPARNDTLHPSTHFNLNGLGVEMKDYMGVKVMEHEGSIDGMLSWVTWVPERHLGVVILTNAQGRNYVFTVLANRILDAYLGAPARDWSKLYLGVLKKMNREQAQQTPVPPRVPNTKPTLALSQYTGTYANYPYPDLVITFDNGTLVARFATFVSVLEHWNYDTFRAAFKAEYSPVGPLLTFDLDADGTVRGIHVPRLGEFTRKADQVTSQVSIGSGTRDSPRNYHVQ